MGMGGTWPLEALVAGEKHSYLWHALLESISWASVGCDCSSSLADLALQGLSQLWRRKEKPGRSHGVILPPTRSGLLST